MKRPHANPVPPVPPAPPVPPVPADARSFADGELEAQQALDLLRQEPGESPLPAQVAHQQALREAVARAMKTPPAPASLRERIAQEVERAAGGAGKREQREEAPKAVAGRIGFIRWLPMAAAAVLLVSTLLVYRSQSLTPPVPAPGSSAVSIIAASDVEGFAQRHVTCTRRVEELYRVEDFPTEVTALPLAMETQLGARVPSLDLSALGYRFDGAGECNLPGEGAAHLIYVAETGDRRDAISLWLRPYDGSPAIEPDRLYHVTPTTVAHPMLLWRDAHNIYYLVGDGGDTVERVADYLRREKR